MKTASCKAKGRAAQQAVRDALIKLGESYGLEPDDIVSTSMGVGGVDVQLSPSAKRLFNLDIECKWVEALNVYTTFAKHYAKYEKNKASLKLLCHKKNRRPMLVTFRFDDYISMLEELLKLRKQGGGSG